MYRTFINKSKTTTQFGVLLLIFSLTDGGTDKQQFYFHCARYLDGREVSTLDVNAWAHLSSIPKSDNIYDCFYIIFFLNYTELILKLFGYSMFLLMHLTYYNICEHKS